MLYHVFSSGILADAGTLKPFATWELPWLLPVTFGFTGVYLFFVISGFCIHLRWAKSQAAGLETDSLDFFAFWKRRFKRLYPAYLAALLLFISAEYYLGTLQFDSFFTWDLVSHVLMIHNLDNRTVYSMNGVFWTLAIEEQLYLLYFALMFLRKRLGWAWTLGICFAARVGWAGLVFAIYRSTGFGLPFSESSLSNWSTWALGALAVEAFLGVVKLPRWTRSPVVGFTCLVLAAGIYLLDWVGPKTGTAHNLAWLVSQPLFGFSFFVILGWFVSLEYRPAVSGTTIFRVLAYVGLFSYSIYLIHEFVFLFIPADAIFLRIVSAVAFAWLFYLLFERPFMGLRRSKTELPIPATGF
jgi:peptidoglycan/LPS O-acetylase OafA/YrhL